MRRKADKTETEELAIIYDEQCPVCSAYSAAVEVDTDAASSVRRVNARSDDPLVRQAREAGLDLDDGMVVVHKGKLYHGAEALNLMARLAPDKGFGNRLNRHALADLEDFRDSQIQRREVIAEFQIVRHQRQWKRSAW